MAASGQTLLLLLLLLTLAEMPCSPSPRLELLHACMPGIVEGSRVRVACLDGSHVDGYECGGGCHVGMFCQEDVEEGVELLKIERSKTILFPARPDEELQRRFSSAPQKHAERLRQVAHRVHLPLLWELYKAKRLSGHPIHQYMLTIPSRGQSFLNWEQHEREILACTNLGQSVQAEVSDLDFVFRHLSLHEEMTWDDFLWGHSIILERCFLQGLLEPAGFVQHACGEDMRPCFIPVMDLINHDLVSSCEITGDSSHIMLRAKVNSCLRGGEEADVQGSGS
eukprot:746327-Hanusia_phi.AAC.1